MNDFLNAVTVAFRRLVDQGLLAILSSQYDEQAFGNAIVVLSGGNVLIRLTRDRGDVSADMASIAIPDEWAPLERVLTAVGVSAAPAEGLLTPTDAASLVEQHFSALNTGLGETRLGETRTRLAEIKRFKTVEAMHRLGGGKS
jgi:hypothetical protein